MKLKEYLRKTEPQMDHVNTWQMRGQRCPQRTRGGQATTPGWGARVFLVGEEGSQVSKKWLMQSLAEFSRRSSNHGLTSFHDQGC